MNNPDDLIIAPASAQGPGLRGILRLSGPDVFSVVTEFFRAADATLRKPDKPTILQGTLSLWPEEAVSLAVPCRLYFWPEGRGFTGQESVELHLPGTPALLDAVLTAFMRTGKVRMAGPGEFTMRAFFAGRIDLTQAEAVLGIIDANDTPSLETACEQLAGRLASELVLLRDRLFDALCLLEAGFDFSEEDIDFISHEDLCNQLLAAQDHLAALCRRAVGRDVESVMPQIVLFGPANSGKSSLWNAFGRRFPAGNRNAEPENTALVSNIPGTTRDYLEQTLEIDGHRFLLVDTAGREEDESQSMLSRSAWAKTSERVDQADIVLWCRELSAGPFPEEDRPETGGRVISVFTKGDLGPESVRTDSIITSANSGMGLDELGRKIVAFQMSHEPCEIVPTTAQRCRESLVTARAALATAIELAVHNRDDVLVATELRHAINQIGLITGQVCTEDLLDRIFSKFCIGK